MFRVRWLLGVFLICTFLLAACQPQAATPTASIQAETTKAAQPEQQATEPQAVEAPTATSAPPEKSVVHFGWSGKPDTLNPAYAFLVESYIIFELVYSTLTKEGVDGNYVGNLAKEWKASDDGLTWTYTLKEGAKWHDGTPMTADDVAWAYSAVMKDPEGWSTLANYISGFKEVKAIDESTLQITLDQPISNMDYRTAYVYIFPRKVFEQFKNATELQNFTNFEILGSGPFKMNKFDKEKGIVILDANPDYFDGRPVVDQVIFQTFENTDALVQALKVGDVDAVTEVPNTAFQAVSKFENVKVVQEPGRSLSELIINSVPANHDPAPTRNKALEDPQVRLAIAYAINKPDLVQIVLQGLGKPGVTIIPPSLGNGFWQNNQIQDIPFDLTKANQVLEDAGYKKGSDGVRAKGDLRLEFRLQFPSDSTTAPRVADLMTGWFKEAGMKTNPQSVDPDALTAAITPAGDFDLVLWGWTSDPDPDFMLSVLLTDQFVEGGWSDSGYSNPEYDKLYKEQQLAVDRNERQKIIWKMQEMVFNDKPYIVYWFDDKLEAYRSDRFTGWIESPILNLESPASLLHIKPVK